MPCIFRFIYVINIFTYIKTIVGIYKQCCRMNIPPSPSHATGVATGPKLQPLEMSLGLGWSPVVNDGHMGGKKKFYLFIRFPPCRVLGVKKMR